MSQTTITILVGCIGLLFALVGGKLTIGALNFRKRARRTHGQVVGLRPRRSGQGVTYHPIVRFVTASGIPVEAETPSSGNPPPARPGQQVAVLYDPDAPTRIRLDTATGDGFLFSLIFLGIGIVLLVFAVVTALTR
ncbi:Protein of unknown function [Nonomuraea maritima]|uniref:DUF3592 domain-containing protein n=1 Tax=Nonomuraea maritima TaxID=683260 RepID=A0A1G8ST27_9ACTN|nr:DUF3592 domain-containing protein [Nonomuraea maritima]SDJ31925.1 Protein of unknown function [Nonomuraea maritima]